MVSSRAVHSHEDINGGLNEPFCALTFQHRLIIVALEYAFRRLGKKGENPYSSSLNQLKYNVILARFLSTGIVWKLLLWV